MSESLRRQVYYYRKFLFFMCPFMSVRAMEVSQEGD